MDIATFIRARLDEDEAVAKGVHVIDKASWHVLEWYDGQFEGGKTARVDLRSSTGSITDRGSLPRPVGAHIARHAPARVLAEATAKRAIVDAINAAEKKWAETQAPARPGPVSFDLARARSLERELAETVLRNLAAPYADHPDYDPAWAVPALP